MSGDPRSSLRSTGPPRPRATRGAVAAILGASSVAAWLVPDHSPGLNLLLLALAAGGAVYVARPTGISRSAALYAGFGLALAATATLRAAEWVVAVNLLAALGLAGLAAADAVTRRDIVLSPVGYLGRIRLVPAYLAAGLHGGTHVERRGRLVPVLRAGVLAATLVAVFGMLFASADRAFADLAGRLLLPDLDLNLLPARIAMFLFAAGSIATLAVARHRDTERPFVRPSAWASDTALRPRLRRSDWTAGLVALDLLFSVFVAIQIAVLFGGHDRVLRTAGLTYAEYAREGFFQLIVVALLTLVVIGGAARLGVRESERDVRRMQLLSGVLCLLTAVVLASAMHRLSLYEEAFGFTGLRLAVHAAIWWVGGLFALVVAAGSLRRSGWLARATVLMTAGGLIAFTAINPDATVARHNVERFARTGNLDVDYLARAMSADAVPALVGLPEPARACILGSIAGRLGASDHWAEFNLARRSARTILERHANFDDAGPCGPAGETP